MQKVTVLCVGKLKERFYIDAAAEYAKRLSRFCQLEIVELPEERLPDNPSQAQIDAALAREGEAIRARIPAGAAVTALCVEGPALLQRRAGPAHGPMGQSGRGTAGVPHRRVLRPAPFRQGALVPAPFHVPYDLSSSSCPGDAAGADLSGLSDQRRFPLSQVTVFQIYYRGGAALWIS